MTDGRTYVLIGGNGFVGYHLCRVLRQERDPEIVSYDAHKHFVSSRSELWEGYLNYRKQQTPDVTHITGNATNRERLAETLNSVEPDVVVYLAALPIATVANEQPLEARRNILDGFQTTLEVVRTAAFSVERVVYVSSSMVYGDFPVESGSIVSPNEESACNPKGVYGTMKLAGELTARTYQQRFGIPYTIVRPSAVYGPTDCNGRVTETFLTSALRGEPLRLDNGGSQTLDFTYVKDLASGLLCASIHPTAENETYNLTFGKGYTVRELAATVQDLIPDVQTYTDDCERIRPRRGALDISKARNELGYDPEYTLPEGLREYLSFIRRERFETQIKQ